MGKTKKTFKQTYEEKYVRFKPLLGELVKKNIKLQYRNSVLGVLWTFLQPLMTMAVLSFVFGNLFGRDSSEVVNYSVYLLSARLLYDFFTQSTKKGMRSIRSHSSIIKKVYVPKFIYPISTVLSCFVTFTISLSVLVVVIAFFNITNNNPIDITGYIFMSVIPIAILFVLCMGVSLILSTLNVFFKDVENLYDIFCLILFYMTPIVYTIDKLGFENGSWEEFLIQLNPLFGIIDMFRACILFGPDFWANFELAHVIYCSAFAVVCLIVGIIMFYKNQDKFILHI
ncbi:MAG: ABC transporter permease [Clostridia bacterium]